MKYIQGEAFKTLDELAAALDSPSHIFVHGNEVSAGFAVKWTWATMVGKLDRGELYHAIPVPEPVRCPCCHGEVVQQPGDIQFCSACHCEFHPRLVKPCPDCAKANAELDQAQAERDDYKGRCERAERYIDVIRGPDDGMSKYSVRRALAILRGEDRG